MFIVYSYRKLSMSFELSESLFNAKFNAEHNGATNLSTGGLFRRFVRRSLLGMTNFDMSYRKHI